jgi:hypothetical protein
MEKDRDIEAFEVLAAKLGARLEAADPAVAELLRVYGEPLQRVLRAAMSREAEKA